MIEIEIRARCEHSVMREKLKTLSARKIDTLRERDDYYKFSLDTARRLVVRIRRKEDKTLLTFKGSSKLVDDVAWQEWETNIEDPESLEKLFLSNGLENVVTIVKERETYNIEDFEINLDRIEGLGEFIEVEIKDEDASRGRARVEEMLFMLGVKKDSFVNKGYVPLMLEQQEK